MPYYSTILSSVVVNGALCALIAKKQPITRAGGDTFKVLHSCLMSRYRWEVGGGGLHPPLLNHATSFAN